MPEIKQEIKNLVEKYKRIADDGQIKSYNEEMTKKDFILPLFRILGWNIEDSREVSAEVHTQSSGRVDYAFLINGFPKFYLEAKALKEDLNKEDFARQAIRYSWNKGVTWAVLTDFESIKIFNAQTASKYLGDKMFKEIKWAEYLDRFDELWLLSKESVEQGLLDKEAEKGGKKLQKLTVSEKLYEDLNLCREELTKELKQWNKNLNDDDLDEGVQRILDRLVFIRVAEDRGLEPERSLLAMVHEYQASKKMGKIPLFKTMVKRFRELDEIYDSNLFTKHPCEDWEEFSGVMEKVIKRLYGVEGYYEYDFKQIPADVLGSVYENYLGYRLSKSKKGVTLDKDAKKRKEQGIYYTPTFIVDYIVKNALKPVLDRCQNINDLKKIKVLDPACGSGSFLVKALEIINEKYKEFGNKGDTYTKLDILLNNIYGVDLDKQAVEIARLNLLINALDKKMKLPSLADNIKNGNSLISGEEKELKEYFGKDWREKKPFNWEEEFPEVFKQGGFDVVIGNPPYVRVDSLEEADKELWKKNFITSQGKYDLYYLFIELSIKLLKERGDLGFIVPNKFCVADSAENLRKTIFDSSSDSNFFSVSKIDIFKDAANYPVILLLTKGEKAKKITLSYADTETDVLNKNITTYEINYSILNELPSFIVPVNISKAELVLVTKVLNKSQRLKKYLKISEGLRIPVNYEVTDKNDFGIVKQFQFERYSPILYSTSISKKDLEKIIKPTSGRFENILQNKILIAEDALRINATLDTQKYIPQGGVYFAVIIDKNIKIKYILAILNSKLMSFIYKVLFGGMHMGGGYLRFRTHFLNELPIIIDIKNESEFISLADNILNLFEQNSKLQVNSDKWNYIKSEIEKADKLIDQKVYELYGLTEEEREVVEGA